MRNWIRAGGQRLRSLGPELRRSTTFRQTVCLYVSQIGGLVLGLVVSMLNTRWLGPADFGLFSTTMAAAEFVTLFMDFGFFSSGARVLALKRQSGEEQRRLIGLLIVIGLAFSVFAAGLLWGVSFFAMQLLNAPIEKILRWFSILLGFLSLQSLVEAVCRGTNRIGTLSIFNFTSRAFGLLVMGGFLFTGKYSLTFALSASLFGFFASAVIALFSFRPRFDRLAGPLRDLREDVRTYGFKVYTGDIASTASYRTDSLLISYFVDTTRVGHYRLATLLINPMITFSRSLSTALFRRFSTASRIAPRVLFLNGAWLASCVLGLVVLGPFLIRLLFGGKYGPVTDLLPIMATVGLLSGLTQPLNMFLASHGRGGYLRTTAFVLTGCNLVFNFVMIPIWGVVGACYASALALFVNLLLHMRYYRYATDELARDTRQSRSALAADATVS